MEIDNLYTQNELDEKNLLYTLHERYKNNQIYTNTGMYLISINPNKNIYLHSDIVICKYKNMLKNYEYEKVGSHIYAIINECIYDCKKYKSILVSGESGSGKSETVKLILEYLEVPLISSINLIIEMFGNACTINNENSSRFGKLINLGKVIQINTFLLERSRVTNYLKESNFHIFYTILNHYNIIIVNDYIDMIKNKGKVYKTYKQIKEAFEYIGVEFWSFEQIILGISYLGGVKIENKKIKRDINFSKSMKYLGIKEDIMEDFLLYKRIIIKGEIIMKKNSENKSIILRDSVARLIYEEMFNILIKKINEYLKRIKIKEYRINILDIFGFEDINDGKKYENGLDQFCINWCNEKIYDEFVKKTFEKEKLKLKEEEIVINKELEQIIMNKSIIKLIEGRCGIIDIISEECLINGNYISLGVKLKNILKIKLICDDIISIEHYAGEIKYNIKDFLEKNKECESIEDLYFNKENNVLSNKNIDNKNIIIEEFKKSNKKYKKMNVVKSFLNNMNELFKKIYMNEIKYIKCIKPNKMKQTDYFDENYVLKQMKANGIIQSVELSRQLYGNSILIENFEKRYKGIPIEYFDIKKGNKLYFLKNKTFRILECIKTNMENKEEDIIRWLCKKIIFLKKLEEKKLVEAMNGIKNDSIIEIQDEVIKNDSIIEIQDEVIKNDSINEIQDEVIKNDSIIEIQDEVNRFQIININEIQDEKKICKIDNNLNDVKIIDIIKNMIELNLKKYVLKWKIKSNYINKSKNIIKNDNKTKLINFSKNKINEQIIQVPKLENNNKLKNKINELEKKIKEYKKILKNCKNYEIIYELIKKLELYELKLINNNNLKLLSSNLINNSEDFKKINNNNFDSNSNDSYEDITENNIFACLVQLYIDYLPKYSNIEIQREEILSLGHIGYFIANNTTYGIEYSIEKFIKELWERSRSKEINVVIFIGSNLLELRQLIGPLKYVEKILQYILQDICKIFNNQININILLEHQELEEYRENKPFYKRIFNKSTINKFIQHLDQIYNQIRFYWMNDNGIMCILSGILSYINAKIFNIILSQKKKLNWKRIRQIEYNIEKIEQYCIGIGFSQGIYNFGFLRELLRVARKIIECDKSENENDKINTYNIIKQITENSFLNPSQIKGLLDKLEINTNYKIENYEKYNRFIKESKIIIPFFEENKSENIFIIPKYLPKKSLQNIFKILKKK